jgi:hypothetical protein
MSDRVRVALAVVALTGALLISVWQAQNPFRGISFDFYARYAAGETVADGESPYDRDAHSRHLAKYGAVNVPAYDAPPVMAAFRILSVVPARVASTALNTLSYLSVGVIAWYVTQRARTRARSRTRELVVWGLAAAAILQLSPVRHTLALGQIDLVALALVLLLSAWIPAFALLKPQTVALTAAAIFGRAIGLGWPPSAAAIQWRRVLLGIATSAALVVFSWVFARSAHWDEWIDRMLDRQVADGPHGLVWILVPVGVFVVVRGIVVAHRAGHHVDGVCVAAGATALLAVNDVWNPQWFLATILPLAAVVVPYLAGELRLDRVQAALLVVLCAAAAGDAYTALFDLDPNYHWELPTVALAGVLAAFCLLRLVPLLPAAAIVVLNGVLVQAPIHLAARSALSMAVAIGCLYLMLELRPSGLRDPDRLVPTSALS